MARTRDELRRTRNLLAYAGLRRRPSPERVLILGAGALTLQLVDAIHAQAEVGYEIVGIVDNDGGSALGLDERLISPLEDLARLIEETKARRVFVTLAEPRGERICERVRRQAGTAVVEDGVEAYERLTGRVSLDPLIPSRPVCSREGRDGRWDAPIAWALSRLAALVALVLTAPLLAVIAVSIKLESGDPVLFVQERIGLHGRPFRLFKFRSMIPDLRPHSEWVCDNTARITMVGKWLRKFHLDELPQLINILRGDMDFIGPRPHPSSNYALFAARVPHYALRCRVRPGVTGWAQVRFGYANNLEEEIEKMRYDLYYIKHVSVWLDVRILLDTVKLLLLGRHASSAVTRAVDDSGAARREMPRVAMVPAPVAMASDARPAYTVSEK
jgi:lipopolysaccharide/colanic/teichoic acid biosynthesis glycosyltransferase